MTVQEMKKIKYFSKEEIARTGGNYKDSIYSLFQCLDRLREIAGCPIYILKNGLTSGNHKSAGHSDGLAADIRFKVDLPFIDVFKMCLECGFKAIGVYWNDVLYTYHVEISYKYRFWAGIKKSSDNEWIYESIFSDPKNLTAGR